MRASPPYDRRMTVHVPLVRVEGKTFVLYPNLSLTPSRFAEGAPLERDARDQTARDAETRYGLGDCLYFYAGYACPDFGDVVLAYAPSIARGRQGNATSFDTGGMFKRRIHGAGLTSDAERDSHVRQDWCDLAQWETRFEQWIHTYFSSVEDYLSGTRPLHDDPSGRLLHATNDRRAWTFEVRLHEDLPLFDDMAFCMVLPDFFQDALHAALPLPTHDHDRLVDLKHRGVVRLAVVDPCAEAATHILAHAKAAVAAAGSGP